MNRPTVNDFDLLDSPEVCHKECILNNLSAYTTPELVFFCQTTRNG